MQSAKGLPAGMSAARAGWGPEQGGGAIRPCGMFLAGTIGKKGIQTEKALAISRKGLIFWLPETDLNRQPSD